MLFLELPILSMTKLVGSLKAKKLFHGSFLQMHAHTCRFFIASYLRFLNMFCIMSPRPPSHPTLIYDGGGDNFFKYVSLNIDICFNAT